MKPWRPPTLALLLCAGLKCMIPSQLDAASQQLTEFRVVTRVGQIVGMEINGERNPETLVVPIRLSSDPATAFYQSAKGILESLELIQIENLTANTPLRLRVELVGWEGDPAQVPELDIRMREVGQDGGLVSALAGSVWQPLESGGLAIADAGEITTEGFRRGVRRGYIKLDVRARYPGVTPPPGGWNAQIKVSWDPR